MATDSPNAPAEQNQNDIASDEHDSEYRPDTGESSISDILGHPETQTELKRLGSLYALIGLGLGLLALLLDSQVLGSGTEADIMSGIIAVVLFGLLVFIGPVIAALSATMVYQRFEDRPKHAWVTSAVGNGVGFIAMVLVTVLFVNSVFSGEEGEIFNLSDLLGPMFLLAIPPAIVGAGAAYVHTRFR